MALPMVMLGGVPIVIHAGPPVQQLSPLGGPEIVRLSRGAGVSMTHWQKFAISISGSGWMPPGLDGLDYAHPLELRCTQPLSIVGAHRQFRLSTAPRPDVEPWAQALVGGDWVGALCTRSDLDVSVSVVTGAELYQVSWMPVFTVSAKRPQGDVDPSTAVHGWRIDCEEL